MSDTNKLTEAYEKIYSEGYWEDLKATAANSWDKERQKRGLVVAKKNGQPGYMKPGDKSSFKPASASNLGPNAVNRYNSAVKANASKSTTAGTPVPDSQLSPSEKKSLDLVRAARAAGSLTGAPGTSRSSAPPAKKLPSPVQADVMDRNSRKPSRYTLPAGKPNLNVKVTSPSTSTTSAPTKPAVPTGTTAGGTTFQRRAATGVELRAAQAARAAGKGEEGAIKSGVEAGKSTAPKTEPKKRTEPLF